MVKFLQVTPSVYKYIEGSLAVMISKVLWDNVDKGCFLEVGMKF